MEECIPSKTRALRSRDRRADSTSHLPGIKARGACAACARLGITAAAVSRSNTHVRSRSVSCELLRIIASSAVLFAFQTTHGADRQPLGEYAQQLAHH